jgi:hypothetical protein
LPMFFLRGRAPRLTKHLVTLLFALSVLALVAHAGFSKQDNLAVIGLALPIVAAVFYVMTSSRAQRGNRLSPEAGPSPSRRSGSG